MPTSTSSTKPEIDTNNCLKIKDIPQEKIDYCEKTGGKFVTKENENGCLAYVDCIGSTTSGGTTSLEKPINKEVLSDKTKLLSLAVALEGLRIDLQKTAEKVQAIANYYTEQGDINSSAKFTKAVQALNNAVISIDDAKKIIRDNIDTFNENDGILVRNKISGIRETLLKEALLAMLE